MSGGMNGSEAGPGERVEAFGATCRQLGLKVTPQRMETYRAMILAGGHPDARTIFSLVRRRIPAISFDTVYRTLHLLEEKGVIARVATPGESARFDANTGRHHHFTCTQCGTMTDFLSQELDAIQPPGEAGELGVVHSLRVELRGICRKCAGRGAASK
ncbi:MAG TPA: Fur family transcriptional regulator [Planctomycetota bacterium]|nr:Fur family transcriptional regulator [Planctomycetota bacterium]